MDMIIEILVYIAVMAIFWFSTGILAWMLEIVMFHQLNYFKENFRYIFHPMTLYSKGMSGTIYAFEVVAVFNIVMLSKIK